MMRRPIAMAAMAAAFLLASCVKTQEGRIVRMRVGVTVPDGFRSDMMRMFLYDRSSGRNSGEIFLSERAGDAFTKTSTLRCGDYDILSYNFDIPDTFLRGESEKNTLEIYTKTAGEGVRRRFLLEEDTQVVYSPDRVIAGSSSVSIAGGQDALEMNAADVTETWHIEIKAEGAQYAAASGCIISGELITLKPFDKENSAAGSIYFDLQKGSGNLYADFNTFGHSGSEVRELTVFVNNGTEVYNYSKPVKALMDDALKAGTRRLVLPGSLKIPAPQGQEESSGGFTPTVGEWGEENSEILI